MAGSGRARRAPRGPLWASFRGLPARAVARYRAAFAQVAGGSGWVAFALPISAPATGHDGPSLTRMFLCICIPWLVCYVAACIIWPYAKCLKCKGTGQHPSPFGGGWRLCRRCGGSKRRLRIGRRTYNYFYERRQP
jgi:hypothetical protein